MRKKVYSSVALGVLGLLGVYFLCLRQEELQESIHSLRAAAFERDSEARLQELSGYARARAMQYEEWLEASHLDRGLVVGRHLDTGAASSLCDSLLFSSLRYVALRKLGLLKEAEKAFATIERENFVDGRWIRHPSCKRKASSRDMIVGLMAAIGQEPEGHNEAFAKLMGVIARTGGSVDNGPFYVSRLSPGMSELLRQMALVRGYPAQALPPALRVGFATVEFDSWIVSPGFRSHLNALTLWIELDLMAKHPELEIRSISEILDTVTKDIGWSFREQRRAFAAESLYRLDPENIFFEYLRLRTAGALSASQRLRLLEKLLALPAFPSERLPRDCDRRADYLWQRASEEYQGRAECHEAFPGVDFTFMVSLLLEGRSEIRTAQR